MRQFATCQMKEKGITEILCNFAAADRKSCSFKQRGHRRACLDVARSFSVVCSSHTFILP